MDGNKKILVVEDEQTLREPLVAKLKSEGFNVIEAENGEDGLAQALKEKPNLILLDVVMPKLDGLSMLARLREDEWGSKVPVIILTNLSSPDQIMMASEHNVKDYLIKTDWKLEEVAAKVKERLN